jgi:anti-sigma regulatory factor (Ser/Thr protein kinase)
MTFRFYRRATAMSERPYFSSSIEDLEAMFVAHLEESQILLRIDHELSFRTTKKARQLRTSVTEKLAKLVVTVRLPSQFEGVTLSKVAAEIKEKCPNGLPPEINIDFDDLKFIRPAGVVFLSNLVHWMNVQNTKANFCNTDVTSEPIRFLDDSLFFEQHCGEKIREDAKPRNTTQPLKKIAHKDIHQWLDFTLVPWLADRLSITKASLADIRSCISELFHNIEDHTEYDIGSIFVQHYPNEKRVTISLSDFGLGIPKKVGEIIPGLADSEAIEKAVEEGFTTKSRATNKGFGLDSLLKTAVIRNDGEVTIYSGKGIVRFYKKDGICKPRVFEEVGFCPGTTIDINLRTDTIEVLPEKREDLEW